jgi:type II secretion system protein G
MFLEVMPCRACIVRRTVWNPRSAFTLIELLIVVAIIAILAAIAVPNFLEAQVRAKISRVRGDMRSVATALESYMSDNGTYVNDSDEALDDLAASHKQHGLQLLTTPIAYISSVPKDPFLKNMTGGGYLECASGADHQGWDGPYGAYSAQGSESPVSAICFFLPDPVRRWRKPRSTTTSFPGARPATRMMPLMAPKARGTSIAPEAVTNRDAIRSMVSGMEHFKTEWSAFGFRRNCDSEQGNCCYRKEKQPYPQS